MRPVPFPSPCDAVCQMPSASLVGTAFFSCVFVVSTCLYLIRVEQIWAVAAIGSLLNAMLSLAIGALEVWAGRIVYVLTNAPALTQSAA